MLLSLANLAFHLAVLGTIDMPPMRALHAGLALIVMIECVIAGRVIPAFTSQRHAGLKLRVRRRLEAATLVSTALALALWVFAPPGPVAAVAFTAAAHCMCCASGSGGRWTRVRPILWILHAAYAWIPIGFALLAFAQLGAVSVSAGVHALAVGATGGLIIGMITRTARGHTGRPLRASGAEVGAYVLVMAAAVLRVAMPLVAPQYADVRVARAPRLPGAPRSPSTSSSSRRGWSRPASTARTAERPSIALHPDVAGAARAHDSPAPHPKGVFP